MKGRLDLASIRRIAAARRRIVGRAHLDHFPRDRVLDHARAAHEIGAAQPHFDPGAQAEELGRRRLAKILLLDPELARERHLPSSGSRVFGIVRDLEVLDLPFRIVLELDLERPEHRHAPERATIEVLAHAVLEQRQLDAVLPPRHADPLGEVAQRRRRIPSPPHAAQRRHPRIVPSTHAPFLDETQQLPLAHQRARHVEAGELVLMGQRARQVERLEQPIVERPMGHELERADTVRHALDVVREPVREVVQRIDTPAVTGVVMRHVSDAVEHRIAQPHVGRAHVDPSTKRARTIGELARRHASEEVQAVGNRAAAIVALLARRARRPAHAIDFLRRVVADVGLATLDQANGIGMERLEVVGGPEGLEPPCRRLSRGDGRKMEVLTTVFHLVTGRRARGLEPQALVGPTRDQPFHVRHDRILVLELFLRRIRVVHPQVANPGELARDAEVQADRLGVPDVQVPVGLGWKPRDDAPSGARGQVGLDDLADEVFTLDRRSVGLVFGHGLLGWVMGGDGGKNGRAAGRCQSWVRDELSAGRRGNPALQWRSRARPLARPRARGAFPRRYIMKWVRYGLLPLLVLALVSAAPAMAKSGKSGKSPEDMAKTALAKWKGVLKLTPEQEPQFESVMTASYGKMAEAKTAAAGDKAKMKESLQSIMSERSEDLAKFLTPDQMNVYHQKIDKISSKAKEHMGKMEGSSK